ncbi:MAG: hypothetical protein GXP04_05250 [Alphaproteobacteria bacterium]|nr:hypothetical protein [Alphaproteobacteria bacterium]
MVSTESSAEIVTYRTHCEPATFEARSVEYNADGTSRGEHNRSNTYCFYAGDADMSEYRGIDKNNQTYYHGVSVTIWDKNREIGRTLWTMVGADAYTDIHLLWEDGKLSSEGLGHESKRSFLERASTEFYPGGDYKFVMDRSYDGYDWISSRNTIEYLKTPMLPPDLPSEWAPRISYGVHFVSEGGGVIILDGNAWGKFIENEQGEPIGFIFASVAPKNGSWVWRTLTWTFKDGIADVIDAPLE